MANKGASKTYVNRGFLNKEEGMAAFHGKVDSFGPNYAHAEFTISDCNRQVALDFDYSDETAKEKSLYKINVLIDELTKFKGALIE